MRRTLTTLLLAPLLLAQEAPPNGPQRPDPGWHAIVAKTIHIRPGETVTGHRIVIKDGKIVSVSPNPVPAGARVWEVDTVYAGFIDAHVPSKADPHKDTHWNKKVTPDRTATGIDARTAKELRALGFTAAVAAPNAGIFRGSAALVSLDPKQQKVYKPSVYQALAFERFRDSKEGFPTAQMGSIAVMRQGLIDGLAKDQRLAFVTTDELEALRGAKVAAEAKRDGIIIGSGRELRRLDAVVGTGLPVILPLAFPDAPDVATVDAQQRADLRALLFWEHAPWNPALLHEAKVAVALTTDRLDKRSEFHPKLRRALEHGLTEAAALAMLTTQPAALLGATAELGTIEPGKRANLLVTEGSVFSRKSRVLSLWIDGKRTEINAAKPVDIAGHWKVQTLPPVLPALGLSVDDGDRIGVLSDDKLPLSLRALQRSVGGDIPLAVARFRD